MGPSTSNDGDLKKMMRRHSSEMSVDSETSQLNLRREYDSAVQCVIQCESIINILQEQLALKDESLEEQLASKDASLEAQLASKDERISSLEDQLASKDERVSSLEDKIVQMSLELASLKSLEDEHRLLTRRQEDEHRLLKRRLSCVSLHSSDGGSCSNNPPSARTKQQEAAMKSYAPVRSTSRVGEDRPSPSLPDEGQSVYLPLGQSTTNPTTPSAPTPKLCPQPIEQEQDMRSSETGSIISAVDLMSLLSEDDSNDNDTSTKHSSEFDSLILGFKNCRDKTSNAARKVLLNDVNDDNNQWNAKDRRPSRRSSVESSQSSGSIISVFEDLMTSLKEETI